MKMKLLLLVSIAAALIFATVPQANAQVSHTPGKKVAYVSTGPGGVLLPGAPAAVLTAQIVKGKKKTVLTVDATVNSAIVLFAPWELAIGVDVNGVAMDPSTSYPFSIVQDCGSDAVAGPHGSIAEGCSVSGTFMIDIDAAEAASVGSFYNVPLNVKLVASQGPGGGFLVGVPIDATMAVRMEKKK